MIKLKAALAATSAWMDVNPKKGAVAAFAVGFVVKWMF
jgi:hypothetical protein